MQASNTRPGLALTHIAIALVLVAPCAFAKKDLFGNEPGSKHAYPVEQLAPEVTTTDSTSSSVSSKDQTQRMPEDKLTDTSTRHTKSAADAAVQPEPEEKNSYFETQFTRFKGHLVSAKEDLFGDKKSRKEKPGTPHQTESSDSAGSSVETAPEQPTISTAEAAQRAQSVVEGQVINVRKYHDEGQPRYAVKLLQKNGRMKTINLDAVNGALIEEKPAEETPQ